MSLLLRKACCSVLLAAVIVGAMAWGISGLFEENNVASEQTVFPTITPAQPDFYTEVMEAPTEIIEGTHTEPNDVYEDGDVAPKLPFGVDNIIATKPDASKKPTTGNGNGSQSNTATPNTGNAGNTGNGGSSSNTGTGNGGSSGGQVTTPPVQVSNVASIIKSHSYSTGLNIFQSSKNDIPANTAALMTAINKGYNKCSFVAIRLSDGATIAYNANGLYNCASSYKALVSLYVYKQAAAGVFNLNTTLTYTAADYYPGSGIIKSSAVGTVYTLGKLADYSIRYSDNIAYTMLQRYINKADLAAFAKKLGCPNASNFATTNWPVVTPVDAALWWAEIYNFSKTSSYGATLYNICLNATNPSINKALGGEFAVAHKSGSTSYYFHDAGVVHSEDPYIIAIYTHNPTNYTSNNQSYLAPIVREIDKLINP